jgi:hypothetical protein
MLVLEYRFHYWGKDLYQNNEKSKASNNPQQEWIELK